MAERTSLAERAYQRIRADLLSGRIRPGAHVTEQWAAGHYAVSRTPVREACRRLAEEGLLAHQPHRGYRVPPIREQEIDELYEIRRALEVLSARRAAAQAADDPTLDRLRAEWDGPPPAPGVRVVYKDEAFHRGLAEVAGNGQLLAFLDTISARIRLVRVHDFLDAERVALTRTQHLAIVDAIRAGDADLAGALMHAHISESQRAVVAATARAARALDGRVPGRRTRRRPPTP